MKGSFYISTYLYQGPKNLPGRLVLADQYLGVPLLPDKKGMLGMFEGFNLPHR